MTVRELMHRWILGCANKPLFYLPFQRNLGKVIIEPMSHIYDVKYDSKQFFAPYCNKSQLTGTIRIQKGKELEPTLGCEYRIYKKVKKASGEYEYVSVLENGIIDRYEKAEMFRNKVEINLPEGTYYYKEYVSGEGDILHFDIEKFEIKAHETTNLIIDHKPKLVQTFFKFVKRTEHFELKKVSGGKPSPDGYGEYGDWTNSWGGGRLFPPSTTRRFTIGTTHNSSTVEYTFKLSPELDVHNAGLTQSIGESPNEKIIPEFTGVVYMGKDFSKPLHKQDVPDDTTRKVYFNLSQERFTRFDEVSSYYDNYYMDFYEVSLTGHHKCNPNWYYDNILIHTGYLMLYHDYQIFNESASYHSIYINEKYSQVSGSVQLTTNTYQGFFIKTPFLQLSYNNSLEQYFYYGYTPVKCEITEENKFAGDSIYILEIKSPITETKVVKDTYKEDYLTDWAYNIDIKQGYKSYYCEEHHKYETLYFIDENKYSKPYLVNTTETTKSHGGGTARGYAAAEDIGGASMWICKAVTSSDPDTYGGYSPPHAAPGLGLYFTVTLYFNKDETYETVTQTYSASDDLLFPMISPHVYKQKKKEYVYSKLNKRKDCVGACNCAVVFVRQTREHYKEWFKVEEPTDWEK